jgi:UDP:flavonoid glycosyltransferase YjiC (YdhE family)
MSKKFTILFVPLDDSGHVNACIGLAECLRDRGHKIVVAIDPTFKGKLISYGLIHSYALIQMRVNLRILENRERTI